MLGFNIIAGAGTGKGLDFKITNGNGTWAVRRAQFLAE